MASSSLSGCCVCSLEAIKLLTDIMVDGLVLPAASVEKEIVFNVPQRRRRNLCNYSIIWGGVGSQSGFVIETDECLGFRMQAAVATITSIELHVTNYTLSHKLRRMEAVCGGGVGVIFVGKPQSVQKRLHVVVVVVLRLL